MSDTEGDIDDELLALAGETEKKRKKQRQAKSSAAKRRKADVSDSDSEQPESEEDDAANPYPLEGKYIDEEDRNRLMEMPEFDREGILAQRLEEMQRIQDQRNLDQMLKAQSGGRGGEESVSKAAKRQHAVRGATKEKTRKLDELKARRKAKDEKKRTRDMSPKREASSSPVDMDMSDDEEEDGQITKYEEQEEKERRILDKVNSREDVPSTLEDLESVRLSREMLVKHSAAPWFAEYCKGAWVRYLIGNDREGRPLYRICEILEVSQTGAKPYEINGRVYQQEIELKHGNAVRKFPMDKVSNGPFTTGEYDHLIRTLTSDRNPTPSKRQLETKRAQLLELPNKPMTESDVSAMLARKGTQNKQTATWMTMERSRLMQARTLAQRRQDYAEVAQIDAQITELQSSTPAREREEKADMLAKVNERNRKANMEAVRRAEMLEAERKRRERKMLAAGGRGTATPGTPEPGARLKPGLKAFNSRPGTPGTPALQVDATTPRSVSPLPSSLLPASTLTKPPNLNGSSNFEQAVLESVELDLGDF
ncbi:plus-3-domain-containing protein [Obba rivulosa]|uniref:Plus-3-domain-containing protein n=1 Tax=Obba rivulosa TaxID=1052685 RepID=A0A8E2DRX7_9APHY|nr:plus-3-domain-containing protein [Obba rivulosa]